MIKLELLKITKEDALEETTNIETKSEMLIVLALTVYNKQAIIPKSIIPNPE